jgi:hypothetical protein
MLDFRSPETGHHWWTRHQPLAAFRKGRETQLRAVSQKFGDCAIASSEVRAAVA